MKENMENTKNAYLKEEFNISKDVICFVDQVEAEIEPRLAELDEKAEYHQYKVIKAMQRANLSDRHFHPATGYGYDDVGREVVETIYADIFGAEDALVRPHISSGTHAISLCLYGVLRPGDELLSITGSPYDTLRTVIGIEEADAGNGTLKDFGVNYKQIELTEDGKIDEEKVLSSIHENTKMIYMQRSTGYSWRKALKISDMAEIIAKIKAVKPDVVVFVDNCSIIKSLWPWAQISWPDRSSKIRAAAWPRLAAMLRGKKSMSIWRPAAWRRRVSPRKQALRWILTAPCSRDFFWRPRWSRRP